ncbi:F-box/kelch-repeat protein [Tripterygium wilfordii]|uniref:F-box/kelch-repeat protein n=1 Tax=Tripterygium wilfordii TaxID=458696 RepID=A0A7J7CT36_TRIWF|nr:F-box/kelch-repeat protein [Tripterygium wilfordii]
MDMRCWSDLPYDILVLIGKKLTIVDHLSFCAVCKDWRSVSKICCPVQFTTESLWLMFLRNPRRRSAQWEIGDPSSGCIYTIDAPLLSARTTRCLLSKHGWLLLISTKPSPSLFFFNPLSQARIDLPWCDAFSGLNWDRPKDPSLPVFAISSPPTSHDCVVWSVRMLGRVGRYECCMIGRGENNWKTKRRVNERITGPILHALFYEGFFLLEH